LDRPRALDEQAHRIDLLDVPDRGVGRRQRQRGDGVLALRRHSQPGAAGREHGKGRSRGKEFGDGGRRIDHLLEVVEDEEKPPIGEEATECFDSGPAIRLDDAEPVADCLDDRTGVEERSEIDPPHTTREAGVGPGCDRQREPGLAHAPRTGQRDHARPTRGQFACEILDLVVTADQRGLGGRR
jgi:hypothetical protein